MLQYNQNLLRKDKSTFSKKIQKNSETLICLISSCLTKNVTERWKFEKTTRQCFLLLINLIFGLKAKEILNIWRHADGANTVSHDSQEHSEILNARHRRQKQPPEVFYKKNCSWKFHNIHRTKRLQHRCFPVNIAKNWRTPILKNISGCCFCAGQIYNTREINHLSVNFIKWSFATKKRLWNYSFWDIQ